VLFESQPNFPVTGLLYLPEHSAGKLPAIVVSPGHAASGKVSDFTFGSMMARNGFAVLTYDIVGLGERLQYLDSAGKPLAAGTGQHGEAGLQPTLIGDAVARYFVWDAIRAVDYLSARPEVDANRIGAFGCSGGGTVTALLGALDPRVKAIATACYLTSYETMLPAIGPQDAEQSIPNFISSGLSFPDWVEAAAPRPYAIVATASDMFPYAGAKATATEARRFYSLFDKSAAGTPTGRPEPGIPTGPTLNPDTPNDVAATAPLQFITGIGGHGNLRPIYREIVAFFLLHLAHSDAAPTHLPEPPAPGTSPFALPTSIPASAFQVTATGQVATSYPSAETVYSLNLKRFKELPARHSSQLQAAIRTVTHAEALPGNSKPSFQETATSSQPAYGRYDGVLTSGNYEGPVHLAIPNSPGRHPAVLLLTSDNTQFEQMATSGKVVLAFTPRPNPPGSGPTKASVLGSFYLPELRAELVGRTLLGLRADDVITAVDFLAMRSEVDPSKIEAYGDGHLGLVLLHAAVLDNRLKHITVTNTLESYKSLVETPIPMDAPEDILPGVLLHYDVDDLKRSLGSRLR
jgi:cephalosporin-C deacetylase-like acetyl esterase